MFFLLSQKTRCKHSAQCVVCKMVCGGWYRVDSEARFFVRLRLTAVPSGRHKAPSAMAPHSASPTGKGQVAGRAASRENARQSRCIFHLCGAATQMTCALLRRHRCGSPPPPPPSARKRTPVPSTYNRRTLIPPPLPSAEAHKKIKAAVYPRPYIKLIPTQRGGQNLAFTTLLPRD